MEPIVHPTIGIKATPIVNVEATYAKNANDKDEFNELVTSEYVDELAGMWERVSGFREFGNVLVLDAAPLNTFWALSARGVTNVDVVSHGVWFEPTVAKKCTFYSGELIDFLRDRATPERPYDGLVLDFCCAYDEEAIGSIFKVLFERRLVHPLCSLIVTFSWRTGKGQRCRNAYLESETDANLAIVELAARHGFSCNQARPPLRIRTVRTLVYRLANLRVLRDKSGAYGAFCNPHDSSLIMHWLTATTTSNEDHIASPRPHKRRRR